MDTNIKIQTIKTQIENMKYQIDGMQMQNNNMLINNNNSLGEQLVNLSFQLFNAGIQAFNFGKNLLNILAKENYNEQLRKISKEINKIIGANDMQQQMQKMMIQQNMMNQMMIQQQFEAQYRQQLIMMKQPMMNQNNDNLNVEVHRFIIIFKNQMGETITIQAKIEAKVEEILDQYMQRAYEFKKEKISFLYNGREINRNEQSTVANFFINNYNPEIRVIEY